MHNNCKIANFMRYRQILVLKLCAIKTFLIPLPIDKTLVYLLTWQLAYEQLVNSSTHQLVNYSINLLNKNKK